MYEYNDLPKKIRKIIDSFDEDADPYKESERITLELQAEGWYANYDLSGYLCEIYPLNL